MISCKKTQWSILMLTVLFTILWNCATTVQKQPIKLDSSFSTMKVDTLTLLPVIDRRLDKSYKIDLENEVRIPAQKVLESKGYSVVLPDSFVAGKTIDPTDLAEMDIEELASLGPDESKVIMLIYLDDIVKSYKVFSLTFKIETTASLISKEKQIELWRDKGLGRCGGGGLVGAIVSSIEISGTINECLKGMFATLPEVPL